MAAKIYAGLSTKEFVPLYIFAQLRVKCDTGTFDDSGHI